jgi:histidyl-tRNA synthetase
MSSKPSIPKGTRDFSAVELAKRNYVTQIIKHNFEHFGYQPLETPTFENYETLMGKYGDEGDRLIFKILNSGNFFFDKNTLNLPTQIEELLQKDMDKLSKEEIISLNQFTQKISEKALRYDLTVPFARYVVMNQNQLEFPFKRYQIQPVWRADRPQKGRFREFYQCDADVVGSQSLWQEVELVQLYDVVFSQLNLKNTEIKINNRKILSGLAEVIGAANQLIDFTVALDKLDKIGEDGVKKEMLEKGISEKALEKLQPLFQFTGNNIEKIAQLETMLSQSEIGKKGIEELRFICENIEKIGLLTSQLVIDVTLARGLNYYTGAIFEVVASGVAMGSIGGGGRYDDLTGIFGLKNMSGVGISFGLDRIVLVLEELQLFPENVNQFTEVLFFNNDKDLVLIQKYIQELRKHHIKTEFYPDAVKTDKQFKYAEKKQITWVVKNIENEILDAKNIKSGTIFIGKLSEFLEKINE